MASISTFKRVLFLAGKYPIPALSMKDGLLRLQLRLGRPLDYRRGVKWNLKTTRFDVVNTTLKLISILIVFCPSTWGVDRKIEMGHFIESQTNLT